MKAILEQNFDELYAIVEERVKCIKPVDQIDTYTKFLMWTSLNEILREVFGGSRFMYMIDINDHDFTVNFIDQCRLISCNVLKVTHSNVFEWPDKQTVIDMSFDELKLFIKQCRNHGYLRLDISQHYAEDSGVWLHALLENRKRGSISRKRCQDMGMYKIIGRKSAYNKVSRWSDARVKLFKIMYFLKEFKCPLLPTTLKSVCGSDFSLEEYESVRKTLAVTGLKSAKDRYISQTTIVDVQDLLIKYIDLVCLRLEKIAGNNIDQTDSERSTDRILSMEIGIRRHPTTRNGVHCLICSEQDVRKIISFIEQLRDIKTNILMTVNNACNLKNIHLLPTIPQNFDISTNKERNNKND